MIPIYLCEDDPIQLEFLKNFIKQILLIYEWDMELYIAAASPKELLSSINYSKAESAVYFLDVDLKSDIDGIQLAVEIRKFDPRAFIIFITTHDEMAMYTFNYKVEPLDYIIKQSPDFTERIKNCLSNVYEKYLVPNNPVLDNITIAIEKKILIFPFDDIYFIEPSSQSHKLLIHKKDELLEFNSSLKEIQTKLDGRFVLCHKAYIVNCRQIESIDKQELLVYLKNGESCPCSVRMYAALCKILSRGYGV